MLPCAADYETDAFLPSNILAAAFAREQTSTPSAATLAALAKRTLLDEADIIAIFKKMHAKAQAKAAAAGSSSDGESSGHEAHDPSSSSAHKRSRTHPPAPQAVESLKKGELQGRAVLCPREQWPEEPCDGDVGWRGVIDSESRGIAGVKIKGHIYHFPVDKVLAWPPLR